MNIQNNLESQSNATQIGAKIPDNSKAFGLINKQDCRSDLLRSLLDDFVTVNGPVANYAMIPEKDRLRKYFNVAPPRKEVRQTIQEGISRLEENKRLLAFLIEYVVFWVEYYRIFLPDPSFTCFISQFIIPSAKKLIENGLPKKGLGYAVMNDMESFGKQCRSADAAGRAQLEKREESVGLAERIFILLAYQWACLSNSLAKDSGYSSADVVCAVLDFMKKYTALDYYNDMFLAPRFTLFVEDRLSKRAAASAPAK